jgi:hypothetical protein
MVGIGLDTPTMVGIGLDTPHDGGHCRRRRRGTQVAKGTVCKIVIHRFESGPRLHSRL